jgi:hypothetical protein
MSYEYLASLIEEFARAVRQGNRRGARKKFARLRQVWSLIWGPWPP